MSRSLAPAHLVGPAVSNKHIQHFGSNLHVNTRANRPPNFMSDAVYARYYTSVHLSLSWHLTVLATVPRPNLMCLTMFLSYWN